MNTVTITSQGQITLPASIRRALNLHSSDKLEVSVNPHTHEISLRKPMTLDEITMYAQKHIDPRSKPVLNADEYYQKYRYGDI